MGKSIVKYFTIFNIQKLIYYLCNKHLYNHISIRTIVKKPLKIEGKKYIKLGRCFIEKNARIEAISHYGDKFFEPEIVIEDNVSIQQNLHLTCANKITISKGTSITPNVGIFDIIHPFNNILINPRDADIEVRSVFIGENCLIGMNSVILPGTRMGKHCIVGALSVVSGNFPDYSLIVGAPARIIKRYCLKDNTWKKTKLNGEFYD